MFKYFDKEYLENFQNIWYVSQLVVHKNNSNNNTLYVIIRYLCDLNSFIISKKSL